MFLLITAFKNMDIKFVGGFSVTKFSYVIIHSMSKIYIFCQCMWYYHCKSYMMKNIKH